MKRELLILLFCYLFTINSFANEQLISDKKSKLPEKWWYAWNLYEKHNKKDLPDPEYTQKLEQCFNDGNGHCALYLGEFYYIKKDYAKAYTWEINATKHTETFSNEVPSAAEKAYYALGLMYMNGHGVLQDYDNAILYLKKAVKYGERNIILSLAKAYILKAQISSYAEQKQDYKNAYAWLKIAQSLPEGELPITMKDGSPIDIQLMLNKLAAQVPPDDVQQANKLARELCATIQGCIA